MLEINNVSYACTYDWAQLLNHIVTSAGSQSI